MTQAGRTGYHLTHQLLYGMLAEQVAVIVVMVRDISAPPFGCHHLGADHFSAGISWRWDIMEPAFQHRSFRRGTER